MKTDTSNTWIQGGKQADGYVSSADAIIVERQRTMQLLGDIFGYHFGDRTGLHVLDLGGGDGIITQYLQERYPDNTFYLLDGAPDMLEKARQRLADTNTVFIQQTFEEYVNAPPEDQKYGLVFSSNAIHHLDFLAKSQVYAKAYRELQFGGVFINIDVVRPESERGEQWQLAMWQDWIDERIAQIGEEPGKYDGLPLHARNKPENKPSKLIDQLQLLGQLGFRDVDCFYKYGVFAMFGGCK